MYELELEKAIELAQQAGRTAHDIYLSGSQTFEVEIKLDNTVVTRADRESHSIIVDGLRKHFPGTHVISEEAKLLEQPGRNGKPRWYVDPIDGTNDFITKTNQWAIHIGYVDKEGVPAVGVVYAPALDKLYFATITQGARLLQNGQETKLNVKPVSLDQSILLISRKDTLKQKPEDIAQNMGVKNVIPSGSFGVKVGMMCEGNAHAYVNNSSRVALWDAAAPAAILIASGGKITDLAGNPITFNAHTPALPNGAICTVGNIHQEICERAQKYMPLKTHP